MSSHVVLLYDLTSGSFDTVIAEMHIGVCVEFLLHKAVVSIVVLLHHLKFGENRKGDSYVFRFYTYKHELGS